MFTGAVTTAPMTALPLVLVPTVLVPLSIAVHLTVLRRLGGAVRQVVAPGRVGPVGA